MTEVFTPHPYIPHLRPTLDRYGFPDPQPAWDSHSGIPCDTCGASQHNPSLHPDEER